MRVRILSSAAFPSGWLHLSRGLAFDNSDNRQATEPVRATAWDWKSGWGKSDVYLSDFGVESAPAIYAADQVWIYRNKLVTVEDAGSATSDEVAIRIKHLVLSDSKDLLDLKREVELLEKLEGAATVYREPIPEAVRIYVWRRDEGRCVRCGGNMKLEFDHIIPLAKGGSNTERNIQLLCEACNRSKGATI